MPGRSRRLESDRRTRDALHNLGNLVAALCCQAFTLRMLVGRDESLLAAVDETSALIIEVQKSLKQMQQEISDNVIVTTANP